MSDMKTCPFCLEEIPAKAIKCRYCESDLDDLEKEAEETVKEKKTKPAVRKVAAPQQSQYYAAGVQRKKGRNVFVPVVILLVILLLAAAGAGYWFLLRDNQGSAPVAGGVVENDVIGSWRGENSAGEYYFQFLPNEMVNIAVPGEGYWFRTQYRLIKADDKSFLELYHRGLAEWERTAELTSGNEGELIMTDAWEGFVIVLSEISDSDFRGIINELNFES